MDENALRLFVSITRHLYWLFPLVKSFPAFFMRLPPGERLSFSSDASYERDPIKIPISQIRTHAVLVK